MKIERHFPDDDTIEKFAEKYDLVMEVHKRKAGDYYAHFKNCDVKGPGVLIGNFGNGATEAEAIENYAKEISDKILVVDGYGLHRQEIYVPALQPSRDQADNG